KLKLGTDAQPLTTTMDKLKETLLMLEEKENVLKRKASQELEEAKRATGVNDKKAAIQCLKKKKLCEEQIEQLRNFQLKMYDQMLVLDGGEAATLTMDALRTGAAAMKAMNIADVDNIMDEISEQHETMKQMQEAVSYPSGAAAFFDEDELEAELGELEGTDLGEQLVPPAETSSAALFPVPVVLLPAPHILHGTAIVEEPEGAELEEQLHLLATTASAALVQVIAGLLPVPLFLRRQPRRMNLPMRWNFEQVLLLMLN
ncbi:vacuolar protein sorting-associated protein 32 homolog 1-like, partial [Eucalyptus grandis]|uniref:vacuolar protein sorting-associated protein 32 homolog 1-like n=1 Tax=Eucalyptus grandis TaxID=71139 RepID=UPI00192E7754